MGLQDLEYQFPRPIEFRLGLSLLHATAECLDPMFPWVFKATLIENAWHRLVRAWLPVLPELIQHCLRLLWPRYALPPVVVLKKPKDPLWTRKDLSSQKADYENERVMYQRLKPLQGDVIPEFFGETRCDGRRALVISLLPGVQLNRQPKPQLTIAEYEERVAVPVRKLQKCGVIHDDDRLTNMMLVNGRIMFIDLERVEAIEPERLEWYCTEVAIPGCVKQYKVYLEHADEPW